MEPYIGEIRMFGGDFAPRGWSLCDGKLLSIQQYHTLFSILQLNYGGDGVTSFALPDLRGRVPVQQGQAQGGSTYNLGVNGGSETIVLSPQQLPPHSHNVNAVSAEATSLVPTGAYPAASPSDPVTQSGVNIYSAATATPDVKMNAGTIAPFGDSLPVKIMQPYLPLNYIIALEGIYPPRP